MLITLLCIGLFISFVVLYTCKTLIFGSFTLIMGFLIWIDELITSKIKYWTVDKKIKESGILDKERKENLRKLQNENSQKAANEYNEQVKLAININANINTLKAKYPYASAELFEFYRDNYYDMTIFQLEEFEDKVRKSNIINKTKGKSNFDKYYSLDDIQSMQPLEEIKEFPIEMKLYKDGINYILYINNGDTDEKQLYQTKNYFLMLDLCNNILNTTCELKEKKKSFTALDVDKILKESNLDNSISRINNRFKH